ncbi:hypothetical protein PR003_g5076 [Phytophthora rubi]|uniref:Uncharacterized protein n=3 Tax=Phytophthora TaxID=4783 RepID=A0A6A4FTU8_9STRA|nr:hypothetical protein PF004_g6249 [Phytophthora fragariae]KAE9351022.1 hypothetical protein PR003_g5076 [Phytophthora rubi]
MAGKIVNAVQKKELDGKSLMELLHQGFEHLIKAKGMRHARRPTRKQLSLSVLVMDICSVNEATACGAIMFLFIIDEATRYKWVFLLEKKSEATYYIIKLLNELRTQFK